ncbi:hypothetical protein SAMN05444166_8162 [Singulisphaera sp. GP187]|uniref:hypothetical protein n=1 Tax=Singulisphaera sp. GP187 TaxID=1882752 RepID=UPI000928CEDE|nr:hypothetical protein [Singulisphaera sp. GP187]SIO66640.1 hypothetical protein SAMN05444166_8162 [Singulisphaera sp. GP187]
MAYKAIVILIMSASLSVGASLTQAAEPTEVLTIRLVHPDRELQRLLALFKGARVPHPAAALAAWKRATRDFQGFAKASEAAIAALNPGMIREFRRFDGAQIGLGLDPEAGHLRWYVVAPKDDGALAALTTAMTLTDGGPDSPYLDMRVDRLGRPGAPLALRIPGKVAIAGSRADLPSALAAVNVIRDAEPSETASGWVVNFNPEALPLAGSATGRRILEAIRASGWRSLEGRAGIEGEAVEVAMTGELTIPLGNSIIEPSWLDWIPASEVMAASVFSIDSSPQAWDARFAWADRVERAAPGNESVAPLRTRLNLLSFGTGVKPEVDLFPQVRGVTAFATSGPNGDVAAIVLAVHVADAQIAERLATQFVPRVVSVATGSKLAPRDEEGQLLGMVLDQPIVLAQRGSTLLFGWGKPALAASLSAKDDPARSAGTTVRAFWGTLPSHRVGAVWPGRLGNPLLADAPPVAWVGRNETKVTRDVVRWDGLRSVVKQFLERVPLETFVNPSSAAQ